jgi:hypothetical protein
LANFPQVPAVGEEQEDRIVNEVIDRLSKSGPMLDKLVKPIGLRIVKSVHWWIAFPLFWVAVLVGSHFTIKGALESLMISRIDQEFREPRIQATMQKVINDKASEMLTMKYNQRLNGFELICKTNIKQFPKRLNRSNYRATSLFLTTRLSSMMIEKHLKKLFVSLGLHQRTVLLKNLQLMKLEDLYIKEADNGLLANLLAHHF